MTDILHGLHDDLPARCYHRSMGISKSNLDLIHRSPALFDLARQSPRPSTPAQALGTAVHLLVLEPGRAVYRRDLATYAECLRSGEWPGYPEEIRELELPAWARVVKAR